MIKKEFISSYKQSWHVYIQKLSTFGYIYKQKNKFLNH